MVKPAAGVGVERDSGGGCDQNQVPGTQEVSLRGVAGKTCYAPPFFLPSSIALVFPLPDPNFLGGLADF